MSARVSLHGRDHTFTPHVSDWGRDRMAPPLTPLAKQRAGSTFPKTVIAAVSLYVIPHMLGWW